MVSMSGAPEGQPVQCTVRQIFLIQRGKGDARYGYTGLEEAVGTICVFLEPYLSTILKPPQRSLAPHDRNVMPARQ